MFEFRTQKKIIDEDIAYYSKAGEKKIIRLSLDSEEADFFFRFKDLDVDSLSQKKQKEMESKLNTILFKGESSITQVKRDLGPYGFWEFQQQLAGYIIQLLNAKAVKNASNTIKYK